MVLAQLLQVFGFGILTGIVIGYVTWKFPAHRQQYREWRRRRFEYQAQHLRPREQAYVDRIHGAFRLESHVPNQEPEYHVGERILNYLEETPSRLLQRWRQFLADTAPRDVVEMVRELS